MRLSIELALLARISGVASFYLLFAGDKTAGVLNTMQIDLSQNEQCHDLEMCIYKSVAV